jgi:hypothetical protein
MINGNWSCWITASLAKYFGDNANGVTFYVEGDTINFDAKIQWVEFRMDGPEIQEITSNYYRLEVIVNLLVSDVINNSDLYSLQRLVGAFSVLFKSRIPIFKYGTGILDDGTLLTCLEMCKAPKDKVDVGYFGKVGPTSDMQQAMIEAHYYTHLTGE